MNESPLISICVPAYKRIDFLKRLFDSIAIQTYRHFEVVITDDSPDKTVEEFIRSYNFPSITYHRNPQTLGTPENWNEAIRRAKGTWIKLMHDDDWFASAHSLQAFYETSRKHPKTPFIFSAFQNVDENRTKVVRCSLTDQLLLKASPLHLFKKVYVGNPSCTFIRKDINLFYDNEFKWVVDFEYYIRCLRKAKRYHYIDEVLLSIGFNPEQVTNDCFRVPEVELPECHRMLEKFGFSILRNVIVYDYYWRLYRNLGIRNPKQLALYYNKPLHPLLAQMLSSQQKISPRLLKNGVISKTLMFANYLLSLSKKV